MSDEEIPRGQYRDKYGRLQKERRAGADRRHGGEFEGNERRKMLRRKADREVLDRAHREMIEEALDDFAAEHDGHL